MDPELVDGPKGPRPGMQRGQQLLKVPSWGAGRSHPLQAITNSPVLAPGKASQVRPRCAPAAAPDWICQFWLGKGLYIEKIQSPL